MTKEKENKAPYVLALDLDNTVSCYTQALRAYMVEHKGFRPEQLPEPNNYNMVEAGWPFADYPEFLEMHNDAVTRGLFLNMKPQPGAIEAINELRSHGVVIQIVTHRLLRSNSYAMIMADTARWLDRVGLRFNQICFSGEKERIYPDAYVEDSPSNIERITSVGTKCFVHDQLYNRHIEDSSLVTRFHLWSDPKTVQMILDHKESIGL